MDSMANDWLMAMFMSHDKRRPREKMERTTTQMDSILFGAVHRLAAKQGREDSEVLEDAVSYYLLTLGSLSDGEVSQERRALAREAAYRVGGLRRSRRAGGSGAR